MPDDQQIRRALLTYAQGVDVDADADLARALDVASTRSGRGRRVALLTAVPVVVAAVVLAVLVLAGGIGQRGGEPAARTTESRLDGTWVRTVIAGDGLPTEAAGTWTMVLGADGAMTLVPPEAWSLAYFQPNGVFVRGADALRTNVFAGESCAGTAGEYFLTVGRSALELSASVEPCDLRAAVLDGRWDREP